MHITLACTLETAPASADQLKSVINEKRTELAPLLTSELRYYSENARYVDGSLEILDIQNLSGLDYSMSYRYQWHIFNACLDINTQETVNGSVRFTQVPQGLIFDIIDNTPPSPADEL
ncbi:hypothetical protein HF675_18160 [Serratia sp. JUb9]|uniref:hypothetical protein n=1 Tax=unclassified Serratia (in: enterobacteria) TaxID=2647522 RepID=UPI000CF713AB|nr:MULTISPECIES: hypothetical protein [unclassified Serratia (in: enterobacteria)]AVJ16553.1 hypothetical protein CLM71_05085 [Serratia sp. MYb239]MBU3893124.1 hypothetical protein [Serratia rubidaea]QNK31506.1 hypothetical protein HF675_18160 [Serratia sp. JUb9]